MSKQFKGFVLGAVVGGVAALLFAPKSGRELRAKLLHQTEAMPSEADETVAVATEDNTEEVNDRLQQQADEIARQLREGRQADLTPAEAQKMNQEDEEIIVNVDPVTEKVDEATESHTDDQNA